MGKSSKPATTQLVWPTTGPLAELARTWAQGAKAGWGNYSKFQGLIGSTLDDQMNEWGVKDPTAPTPRPYNPKDPEFPRD